MSNATIVIQDLDGLPEGKAGKLIQLSGQFDETNVDEQAKQVYTLIESGGQGLNLVFDFSAVEYVNSKFIGYFTDWFSKISGSGGKMVIAAARDNILDIFQVVGLTQLVNAYGTLEEAKLALGQ